MRRIVFILLAAGLCILFVHALQAQSHVCVSYGSGRYLSVRPNALMKGTLAIFDDADCLTQTDSVEPGSRGWAYASTQSRAKAICRSDVAQLSGANPSLWRCIARKRGKLSSNLLRPARPTGETINKETLLRLYADNGMESGIQFQRVREMGIGQPAIINLGWLDAVNVWGNVGAGYKVCFPQAGRPIFLDAAYPPRMPREAPFEMDDGYTCVALDTAGTIVLVADPAANTDKSQAIPLAGCSVTTLKNLYLRDRPEGTVQTRQIPGATRLPSWSRTAGWFAIQYDGHYGWVAERFVTAEGNCEYFSPAQA